MIEKTILDRVPKYPGRVILSPVAGKANTFDMVRADEPNIDGTPIDKATLDSIIKSRLTGRYYEPEVVRTVISSRVGITANPIPKSGWVASTQTSAKSGEYIVSCSSIFDTIYSPQRATDGNQSTRWTCKGYANGAPEWWQIQIPAPIAVKAIRVNLEDLSGYGQTFVFQGSENGSQWVDLTRGTFTMQPGTQTFSFANTNQYSYYRMLFSGTTDYSATLIEFDIAEYDVFTYRDGFMLKGEIPTEWTTGQRVTIQMPANFSSSAVPENTLNGVRVTTILQPSKRYELTYNGTAFNVKEV